MSGLRIGASGAALVVCLGLVGCPRPNLEVTPTTLNFDRGQVSDGESMEVTITNDGGGTLTAAIASNRDWIVLSAATTPALGSGESFVLEVTIDESKQNGEDPFNTGTITVTGSNDDVARIMVTASPVYFTEVFEGNFDLEFTALSFVPNPGEVLNFFDATKAEITEFPTDPFGGLLIDFDVFGDPVAASPIAGQTLMFYGVEFDTFYISSDGYVTFAPTAAGGTQELADHFAVPRISGLAADYVDGDVSFLQTADRVIITYQNMVEAGKGAPSSDFQIEMLFDGRIQLSYLNVNVSDAIAGLSFGGGVPIDFEETDFTDFNTGNVQ